MPDHREPEVSTALVPHGRCKANATAGEKKGSKNEQWSRVTHSAQCSRQIVRCRFRAHGTNLLSRAAQLRTLRVISWPPGSGNAQHTSHSPRQPQAASDLGEAAVPI